MRRRLTGWAAAIVAGCLIVLPMALGAAAGDGGRGKPAQEAGKPAVPGAGAGNAESGEVRRNLDTLESLLKVIQAEQADLEHLEKQRREAKDEEVRKDLDARIQAAEKQLEDSRASFGKVATGISEEDSAEVRDVPIQKKIEDLLSPLFQELEEATENSRLLESLRNQRDEWTRKKGLASEALARIDALLAANHDEAIAKELRSLRSQWELQLAKASSEVEVVETQIAEMERQQRPLISAASDAFTRFWRTRGLNVILAILAFFAAWWLSRWLYKRVWRLLDRKHVQFPVHLRRVADVSAALGSILLGAAGALMVLYFRDDWVLLTLAGIFLVGLAWAARNTIMPMLEQLRVVLNLGPVREGERMVFEGVPWRLDKLGFYSEFSNPELEGGVLRLPVRELTQLHSRPYDPKEPWFPTRNGDWVIVDGTYGRVVHQSPEQVVVLSKGGERKTYRTADFLAECPINLSHGFRDRITFGIDYRHQDIVTTDLLETMQRKMMEGLVAEVGHEAVESVEVEFEQAGDSSLNVMVIVDFTGDMAKNYNKLRRTMARLCVDACNENGWVIPFPQIVVHQGGKP